VRVIEDYERIGRVEPLRSRFDLHVLARKVAALQPFASSGSIVVRTELAADPASCYADPDLVGLALENLLRNASEAMPEGGAIQISTRAASLAGTPAIALAVQDTGVGMDARQREHAFDQLYTTKPGGTGLGLAFVKRVVEAQGGSARLTSAVGRGTRVEVLLPVAPNLDAARDD
jgi:signal transduction histidine kinase